MKIFRIILVAGGSSLAVGVVCPYIGPMAGFLASLALALLVLAALKWGES
jgi:uncharacterized Ntn-hydrolase superfamily protein